MGSNSKKHHPNVKYLRLSSSKFQYFSEKKLVFKPEPDPNKIGKTETKKLPNQVLNHGRVLNTCFFQYS